MKTPAAIPAKEATTPAPMPQAGGSYIRMPDGTLQREEATNNDPAAREAPVEDPVQAPVQAPVLAPGEAAVETPVEDPVQRPLKES